MLVRNKRTKVEQEITAEAWHMMQENGLASRFRIIRKQDAPDVKLAEVPEEVVKLRAKNRNKKT